jgi:hypothetical protein
MKPVVLRENDQLEGVANGFNAMLKGLKDRFGAIIIAYEELDLKRKRLDNGELEVKEMSEEMEKLAQTINHLMYKRILLLFFLIGLPLLMIAKQQVHNFDGKCDSCHLYN